MTTITSSITSHTRASDTIVRRSAVGALLAGAVLVVGTSTAHADHVHSVQTGSGACVLLARNGGEGEVDLPFATETQVADDRAHPIHLLVHLGRPGQGLPIGVYGTASDPCNGSDAYVND